jgi:hypothetical protein
MGASSARRGGCRFEDQGARWYSGPRRQAVSGDRNGSLGTDVDGVILKEPLTGALDDVAIYNRSLTDLEVMMTP